MKFTLPALSYDYDALEPFIDERTMSIHHTKHHMAYINNLNNELEKENKVIASLDQCLRNIDNYSEIIRNNAGGHYNHSFFWQILSKASSEKDISENLASDINKYFGSCEKLKDQFSTMAMQHFGSGWIWLCVDKNKELFIVNSRNQDNPLMGEKYVKKTGTPILGLDIWEHAYYLKYQNNRKDYVSAFWNIINWQTVSELHETYIKMCV